MLYYLPFLTYTQFGILLQLKNYREKGLVMVVIADEVPKFREKLKSLFTES